MTVYSSVKKMPEHTKGAFSETSIRWLIFNEKINGFSRCVRRVGRKILINLDEFEKFVEEHAEGGAK